MKVMTRLLSGAMYAGMIMAAESLNHHVATFVLAFLVGVLSERLGEVASKANPKDS